MILLALAALIGVWRCRTAAYFKWVAILFAWMLAAWLLFSASEFLLFPTFEGAIARAILARFGSGAVVLAVVVAHVSITLYCLFRMWDVYRDVRDARAAGGWDEIAEGNSNARKMLETGGIVAGTAALILAGSWGQAADPPPDSGRAEATALASASAPAAADERAGSFEQELLAAAEELNASGPRTKAADPYTTFVGASASGRTFTYHFELSAPDVTEEKVRTFLKEKVAPQACSSDQRDSMREHGAYYTYSYTSPRLAAPVSLTMSEEYCT